MLKKILLLSVLVIGLLVAGCGTDTASNNPPAPKSLDGDSALAGHAGDCVVTGEFPDYKYQLL